MLQGVQEVRTQIDVDPRRLDWDFVDGLVEVLEDLDSLTTKMQKEVYLMGDFFRDLYLCREDLDNRTNRHVPAMIRLLNSRTNVLLSTVTYSAAIVCDPRFNTYDSIAISTEQREDAIVSIHNTFFLYDSDNYFITPDSILMVKHCFFSSAELSGPYLQSDEESGARRLFD